MSPTPPTNLRLGRLDALRLHAHGHEALVALQGAQVLRYGALDGSPPIVWSSDRAEYEPHQSVRGGVPVCWPWFGDLRRNPTSVQAMYLGDGAAPAHGFARGLTFRVAASGADEHASWARLVLSRDAAWPAEWPHAAELEVEVMLGRSLRIRTTTRNLGGAPLVISSALHTYFGVSDVRQVELHGLAGSRYLDTLDGWREQRQVGPLRFTGETDRVHLDVASELRVVDPGWNRTLVLSTEGSRSCVVWNPWTEKSRRLTQFDEDAWTGMLCVETARVMDDVMTVGVGERAEFAVEITSEGDR